MEDTNECGPHNATVSIAQIFSDVAWREAGFGVAGRKLRFGVRRWNWNQDLSAGARD